MPVEFRCPGCAGLLRVPDEHAGSAVRCPACRATPVAPRAEAPPMAEVVPDAAPEPVARPRAKPRALEPASAPRSSAKLIAGLIALIVALVGAGGFALWRTATAPAEWREFASPKGGYRVELPAAPRADIARRHRAPASRADIARRHRAPTSRADTARRHRAPTSRADIARRHRAPTSRADIARLIDMPPDPNTVAEGTAFRGTAYAVMWTDFPDGRNGAGDDAILSGAINGLRQEFGAGAVEGVRDLEADGFAAREAAVNVPGEGRAAFRVVVTDARLFVLAVAPSDQNGADAARFLDSFRVTDPVLRASRERERKSSRATTPRCARDLKRPSGTRNGRAKKQRRKRLAAKRSGSQRRSASARNGKRSRPSSARRKRAFRPRTRRRCRAW